MTGRERVHAALEFRKPDRLARAHPEPWGDDLVWVGPNPSPDVRRANGTDEWGCVWESVGSSSTGEVRLFPLDSWDKFPSLRVPDIDDPIRWQILESCREISPDKFCYGCGISLYERTHFLRGLINIWSDIYDEPEKLGRLIDVLADLNIRIIRRLAAAGADGFFLFDDWGLQDRLMISPASWLGIWQPRYARVFGEAHRLGLKTFLHSCGYILDIIPGLIEAGLDVLQLDQQMNMGLEALSRFKGKIAFFCPADIQAVMPRGNLEEIRAYCREMVEALSVDGGGFIAGCYGDTASVGHSKAAVEAMCDEFDRISKRICGN